MPNLLIRLKLSTCYYLKAESNKRRSRTATTSVKRPQKRVTEQTTNDFYIEKFTSDEQKFPTETLSEAFKPTISENCHFESQQNNNIERTLSHFRLTRIPLKVTKSTIVEPKNHLKV